MKNLNDLAVEISKREGGKVNLPIAQIKEVMRHLIEIWAENPDVFKIMISKKAKTERQFGKAMK